jgi:hypothetical protein
MRWVLRKNSERITDLILETCLWQGENIMSGLLLSPGAIEEGILDNGGEIGIL